MARTTVLLSVLLAASVSAYAGPILDLSRFYADPEVSFSTGGTTAILGESAAHAETILSDDPALGDPALLFAGPGTLVRFDFEFIEGASGNDDEFGAWIIDPLTGGSLGAPYEFFLDNSGSGTISFDLSGLAATGPLGIQFQLSSLPGDAGTDSTLRVSNLEVVPEPVSLVAIGSLLAGILSARRLKRH